MYCIVVPACQNAKMHEAPTTDKRWPTMIFSHGLGGNRNSYSYNAGSLASHGIVVVCAEHRDGSAIASLVRLPSRNKSFRGRTHKIIPYRAIAHKRSPKIFNSREDQLRIRLWELGLIHEAVLAIDKGKDFSKNSSATKVLRQFHSRLDVHKPGRIMFSGHSFGATTIYQLLKCTYYANTPEVAQMQQPLFSPSLGSSIRKQITEKSVTILLDMWCLPLLAPNSKPLFDLPLPMYRKPTPWPLPLLAIESETFYKWEEHLLVKARLLSPDPTQTLMTPQAYARFDGRKFSDPQFFYVVSSAHMSQSDFGILFPLVTRTMFSAREPKRILRLSLRAQLQLLRANGVPVSRTCPSDLVDNRLTCHPSASKEIGADDRQILKRTSIHEINHWKWIDITRLDGIAGDQGN